MIKPKFTPNDIHKAIQKQKDAINKTLVRRLKILGDDCVRIGRTLNTYDDQTGNLRSSIGCAIYANGQSVYENFESIEGGAEGKQKAQDLAKKEGSKYKGNEIALVVVAGMEYAYFVEIKGRDVLEPSEREAVKQLPIILQKLTDKINGANE